MRSLQKMYMVSEEQYRILQDCINKYDKKRLDEVNKIDKSIQTDPVNYIDRSTQFEPVNPNISIGGNDRSIQASLHDISQPDIPPHEQINDPPQPPQHVTPPRPVNPSKKRKALDTSQDPSIKKKIILDHDPLEDEILRPGPFVQPDDVILPPADLPNITPDNEFSINEGFFPPRTSTPIPPPPPIPILPLESCKNIPTRSPVKTRSKTSTFNQPKVTDDFRCDYCSKRFSRKYNLAVHIKSQHENPNKPSKTNIRPEILTKNSMRLDKCPLCTSEFELFTDYKFHLKNRHMNQLYKKDFDQQTGGSYSNWNI